MLFFRKNVTYNDINNTIREHRGLRGAHRHGSCTPIYNKDTCR